jgi:catechol 1,2-dioxygenase
MGSTGTNGAPVEEMGKEWTEQIINSMGPKTDPRMREVMSSLTRHLHDFAREVDLTFDEWVKGVVCSRRHFAAARDIV